MIPPLPSSQKPFFVKAGLRWHFLGAGGIGMSALACALHMRGEHVQGSDDNPSATLERLQCLGLRILCGQHSRAWLQQADVLVYSSAFGPKHSVWQLVKTLNPQPQLVSRAALLAGLAAQQPSLAVAGTHGKTTTSAALAAALLACPQRVSVFLGGECDRLSHRNYHHPSPAGIQSPAVIKNTATYRAALKNRGGQPPDFLLCEADESDAGFLLLRPHAAILTSVDADHLDVHGSLAKVQALFARFLGRVSSSGIVAYCHDDAGARELVLSLPSNTPCPQLAPYRLASSPDDGVQHKTLPHHARQGSTTLLITTVRIVRIGPQGMRLCFTRGDWQGHLNTPLIGAHNARNLAGVIALCLGLDLPIECALQGLHTFNGVNRRQQALGTHGQVRWFDDYAHHPTEVEATLSAFLSSHGRPLSVVFQPHLYSRTQAFTREFAKALAKADQVIVTEIYAAREKPIRGVSGQDIVQAMETANAQTHAGKTDDNHSDTLGISSPPRGHYIKRWQDLIKIAQWPFPPTQGMVLTLGAGDIGKLGPLFLQNNPLPALEPSTATMPPRHNVQGIHGQNFPSHPTISSTPPRHSQLFAQLEKRLKVSTLRMTEPLAKHTSLRVGGVAECWADIQSETDALTLLRFARRHGLPCHILGNGSNVLIQQHGLEGVVLHLGPKVFPFESQPLSTNPPHILVNAGAGMQNASLVNQCQQLGLAEAAFLAVIPGCVGGAVAMNAGAHGGQVATLLRRVRYIDMQYLQICEQQTTPAIFGYRHSPFSTQHQRVVLQAQFSLRVTSQNNAKAQRQHWLEWRRKHHPRGFSCGSVFKNPPKDHAARLIEACGLKGLRQNGAQISPQHANFILNQSHASANDVLDLIATVQKTVQHKTGVKLELEVQIL